MKRAVALALLLTGCGGEPAPEPTPSTTPSPKPTALPPAADVPGALPAPEFQGARSEAGGWQVRDGAAVFAGGDGRALLTLVCDRPRRKLIVTRAGEGMRLRLITDVAAATLLGATTAEGVRAETDAADPFVRALAKAQGAVGIQLDDGDVLAIPATAIMRDHVADCARP